MQVGLNTRDPYHMVYAGQKGSLVNMDLTTNNILVGPDEGSLFSGNPDCFILGPLNSGYADGTRDLWAIALTGNPVVAFMEGLQNWQPSPAQIQEQLNALGLATEATQQIVSGNTGATKTSVDAVKTTLGVPAQTNDITTLGGGKSLANVNTTLGTPAQTADIGDLHAPGQTVANEVSTTGVPLLSKSTLIHHSAATGIAAGGSTAAGSPYTISQIGYEIFLSLSIPAAATIPGAQITFTWSDSVTGDTVAQEQWIIAAGSAANLNYIGTGPTKGDTLTVAILNLDPAQTLTYSLTLAQNSRVYARDDWRNLTATSVPGQINGNYRFPSNLLLETAPAMAGSAQTLRWMGLYAGDVTFTFVPGPNGVAAFQVFTFLDPITGFNNAPVYQSPNVAANGSLTVKVTLPREQCNIVISNGPAAQTPSLVAIVSEQLS